MQGCITLATDGSWSNSGSKSSMAATSGTYIVSDNKITFNWTVSGNDFSDIVIFSTNGGPSTWTGSQYTFIPMVFGVLHKLLS